MEFGNFFRNQNQKHGDLHEILCIQILILCASACILLAHMCMISCCDAEELYMAIHLCGYVLLPNIKKRFVKS